MAWEPDGCSPEMEEEMELHDLPEPDRDEVRRFAEYLQRRKDVKDGKEVTPRTDEMTKWLLGKDVTDE